MKHNVESLFFQVQLLAAAQFRPGVDGQHLLLDVLKPNELHQLVNGIVFGLFLVFPALPLLCC